MKANKIFLIAALLVIATMGIVSAQQDTNNPVLKFTLSTYDPIPAEPGKLVDVWVNIQNIGDTDANNIVLEFVDSPAFSIVSEQDRVISIPVLGSYKDYTIKYTIKVSENVADGPNNLMINYKMGNMPGVTSTAQVAIDVKSAETPVVINDISLTPTPVSAGGKTTLSFNVRNLAKSSNIRNVDVTIQLTPIVSGGVLVADLPFVTVNSGNQKSIDRIAPGQSGEFKFDLAVYPDAVSQIYKLPVSVSYFDDTGRQYNKTILVGVEVNAQSELLVNLESSDINSKSPTGSALFNVVNRGTSNVKLMTFTLESSPDYEVLSPSQEVYLGKIDSDDFQTAKYDVKINTKDNVTFLVTLKYKDALNNEFTEKHEVFYNLIEPLAQKKSSKGTIFLVIVIIVIIGFVIYRRRKNKAKRS